MLGDLVSVVTFDSVGPECKDTLETAVVSFHDEDWFKAVAFVTTLSFG